MKNQEKITLFDVVDRGIHYGYSVDWIRLVDRMSVFGLKPDVAALQGWLLDLMPVEQRKDVWRPWRCDRFVGWSRGQWAVGHCMGEVMVEVRSGAADAAYHRLFPLFKRCTRMDVAYDIGLENDRLDLARMMRHRFHSTKSMRGGKENDPIDYEHRVGKGKTWGLGKRASSKFFRCYDKSAEQDWPILEGIGRIWRLELEIKRQLCQRVHEEVRRRGSVRGPTSAILSRYLSDYGLSGDALRQTARYGIPFKRKDASSAERTLRWMREKVRPAIDKLIQEDYAGDVLDALDLLELMDTGGPIYGEA